MNRGVALWQGFVYLGSLDGRLIKIDAGTGEKVWEVDTIDSKTPYTITGAPRLVNGKVIIGNGGAEYGVRGYVSAYDAHTGELAWRFWTVPGDPSKPFEHPELEAAAATWNGEWWKIGGGGTVWDSMAYDPGLDLLYVGTGNGSPWSRTHRSPGGGDNLYLSSILALAPDDGRLVWHYQTTPGDNWDYTATQHLILADLTIEGEQRQVIMQAPKNGFFYVLDRRTGELISAEKYAKANWARHVARETGRPVEAPEADYDEFARIISPGPGGAHNWEPMAFSPDTRLVYIPASDSAMVYSFDRAFTHVPGTWNRGLDFSSPDVTTLIGQVPPTAHYLLAWDPVAQQERWRLAHDSGSGGGLLVTAGNLVFQGTLAGDFMAYAADTGARVWDIHTSVGIMAPPVTYKIDGEQYIAVVAGTTSQPRQLAHLETIGRVFVFKLGGSASIPPVEERERLEVKPPASFGTASQIAAGNTLYGRHCGRCHGWRAIGEIGAVPDLRHTDDDAHLSWNSIVIGGARSSRGMPAFGDVLTPEDAEAIRSYVASQANKTLKIP